MLCRGWESEGCISESPQVSPDHCRHWGQTFVFQACLQRVPCGCSVEKSPIVTNHRA
jgi:hypothetical protein